MALLAQNVMDLSASLLNDTGKSLFTYAVQIPYLNMAITELREEAERNNNASTNKTTEALVVLAGVTELTLDDLPRDFREAQHLWERNNGQTSMDYLDMTRMEFLPPYVVKSTCLIYWSYQDQKIKFIGATTDRQLRLDYVAETMPKVIDPTDEIPMLLAESFLMYRTAALLSQYVGENDTRGATLRENAQMAFDRFISINVKGRQAIATRRRPFNYGWRYRGLW